jgi:5'-nucleotidase
MSIIIKSVLGRRIDLAAFRVEDVEREAIARGLSNVCRFAGQVRDFYSVAQHSVHVSEVLRDESLIVQKLGLWHDASEAYIGDVSRQLKHSSYMQGYRILEAEITEVVETALGLVDESVDEVDLMRIKAADDLLAIFERVVVRDSLPWLDGRAEVERAFADGYVAYTRKDAILSLLPKLDYVATHFSTWSPSHSFHVFQNYAASLDAKG